MTVQVLPLSSITVSEDRQRKLFPEQQQEDLKDSITKEHGLMVPIFVRPHKGDQYLLVAGERRLRVISTIDTPYSFGEQTIEPGYIPAVVKEFDNDMSAEEAELHENIVRLNLSWQEQADAVARLHKMKAMQNPKHRVGDTAYLIDPDDGKDRDYPKQATYHKVNESLLVSSFLEDPDVRSAPSLRKAAKIATRKLEEQQMSLLKSKQLAGKSTPALPKLEGIDDEDEDDLLPDLPSVSSDYELTFLEGDMREHIANIPDNSINVVITDPPYGQGVVKFDDGGNGTLRHEYSEDDYEELHEVLVSHLGRVCTSNAHVYVFCDIDYYSTLRGMFSAAGWWVRRKPLIWAKGIGKMADGKPEGYSSTYEFILYARRGDRPCSKVRPDVIQIPNPLDRVHAAQKPAALYLELLSMSAVQGDTVLDTFAGSGVIFKAAKEALVHAIGIEQNEKFAAYCRREAEG